MKFRTILADPPWPQPTIGGWNSRHGRPGKLPYHTVAVEDIAELPVVELAAPDAHLWLWTTNAHLESGLRVMRQWGFKYLAPITWVKPSGMGAWFVHRTQTLLMGYRGKCLFKKRHLPTVLFAGNPAVHSQKPEEAYDLVESISFEDRIELFARRKRPGWKAWGNEIDSDITLRRRWPRTS